MIKTLLKEVNFLSIFIEDTWKEIPMPPYRKERWNSLYLDKFYNKNLEDIFSYLKSNNWDICEYYWNMPCEIGVYYAMPMMLYDLKLYSDLLNVIKLESREALDELYHNCIKIDTHSILFAGWCGVVALRIFEPNFKDYLLKHLRLKQKTLNVFIRYLEYRLQRQHIEKEIGIDTVVPVGDDIISGKHSFITHFLVDNNPNPVRNDSNKIIVL